MGVNTCTLILLKFFIHLILCFLMLRRLSGICFMSVQFIWHSRNCTTTPGFIHRKSVTKFLSRNFTLSPCVKFPFSNTNSSLPLLDCKKLRGFQKYTKFFCSSDAKKDKKNNKDSEKSIEEQIEEKIQDMFDDYFKSNIFNNKNVSSQRTADKPRDNEEKDRNNKNLRFLFIFFALSTFVAVCSYFWQLYQGITWSEFCRLLKIGEIVSIRIIDDHSLIIRTKSSVGGRLVILSFDIFKKQFDEVCEEFDLNPSDMKFVYQNSETTLNILRVAFFLCVVLTIFTYLKFNNSSFFKRSATFNPKKEPDNFFSDIFSNIGPKKFDPIDPRKLNVKFSDVKGCDEPKREIFEFVEFLKNPESFKKMGARIPKGAILYGPPGTGKTLLAKAVATEAGVPFFFAAGSEFVEMLVGLGAKRIRQLFSVAHKRSPCIIFIDEIDAIGNRTSSHRSTSESDQTINQLLCELDGFNSDTNVVVLCGTNQIDTLDKAIIRPGRLDRKIYLGAPDINGRNELFDHYLSKISIDPTYRLSYSRKLASLTPGSTGADISTICNEAAIYATKQKADTVNLHHLEFALDRLVLGNRLSKKLSNIEKKIVSVHESGHAVVSWFLKNAYPLLKVSIIPRGNALGVNHFLPPEDYLHSKEQILDMMAAILGGRAAEEIIIGSISSGASDDLQRVTQMAYQKVGVFGMDESIGLISLPSISRKIQGIHGFGNSDEYGPELANKIDRQVQIIIENAYERAKTTIIERKDLILKLSQELYDKEVLSNEDVKHILGPRPDGAITIDQALNSSIQTIPPPIL